MIATMVLLYFILIKYYKVDKELLFTLIVVFAVIYSVILASYSMLASDFDPQLALLLLIV